jgi:BTB/POZ domain
MEYRDINVGGRIFQLSSTIIDNIPYISNLINDCEISASRELIFINRSPYMFDKVLAFVIDNLHPYPIKYRYELDFYGIEYDSLKLYDPNKILKDNIENEYKVLKNTINNVKNDLIILGEKVDIIENANQCFDRAMERRADDCAGKYCMARVYSDKIYCETCLKEVKCRVANCQNNIGSKKVCDEHEELYMSCRNACISKNCGNNRVKNKQFCFKHITS